MTLSLGPGCVVPRGFVRTFQARPLAVLVASAGASATSAGAVGRARPIGSIGWDAAIGAISSAARMVVRRRAGGSREGVLSAYREEVEVRRRLDG